MTDPRFSALPGRPGKIIAIHLSYASRADQRGRRPEAPSYFLKPSSSIAASGGTIERPAGTELLAFEGEIALVIGTTARRVTLADAWRHVAWITAANDFGLYDLRTNDKGSNVRSKGGDGFTPIGPAHRRPPRRPRRRCDCAPGSTATSVRTTRRPGCCSPSRSWSPTCPSTSRSSRAMSSSPAPPPDPRWSCRAMSSRSRWARRARPARRARDFWSRQ